MQEALSAGRPASSGVAAKAAVPTISITTIDRMLPAMSFFTISFLPPSIDEPMLEANRVWWEYIQG